MTVPHQERSCFFFSPNEWKGKLTLGSAFFTKINAQPKISVEGSPENLPAVLITDH